MTAEEKLEQQQQQQQQQDQQHRTGSFFLSSYLPSIVIPSLSTDSDGESTGDKLKRLPKQGLEKMGTGLEKVGTGVHAAASSVHAAASTVGDKVQSMRASLRDKLFPEKEDDVFKIAEEEDIK